MSLFTLSGDLVAMKKVSYVSNKYLGTIFNNGVVNEIETLPKAGRIVKKIEVFGSVDSVSRISAMDAFDLLYGIYKSKPDFYLSSDTFHFSSEMVYTEIDYPLENNFIFEIGNPFIEYKGGIKTKRMPSRQPPRQSFQAMDRTSLFFCYRKGKKNILPINVGYFMWVVAQAYKYVYSKPNKFGIWGHTIEDLRFEFLSIHENGVVTLDIGS